MVVDRPGLLYNAVSEVLNRLLDVPGFAAGELVDAVVCGTLDAVAADPGLLDGDATRSLADFAGFVAEQVESKSLTNLQGVDLLPHIDRMQNRAFIRSILLRRSWPRGRQ